MQLFEFKNSDVRVWAILAMAVLLIASAYFRLSDLGSLGFYGDEETTAFAARSVAEGNGLKMPSGLPYYRAAPLTLLNAISASVFGVNQEFSYRLPAAIFGLLTPVMLFLLSRGVIPLFLAFSASLLLVFSDWHIITSREARMYAPFMLSFMSTGLLYLRWADHLTKLRSLTLATLAVATLLLHALGLLIVLFPLIWMLLNDELSKHWKSVAASVVFVLLCYLLVNNSLILHSYPNWIASVGSGAVPSPGSGDSALDNAFLGQLLNWRLFSGMSGLLIGAWLAHCLITSGTQSRSMLANAVLVILSLLVGFFLLSAIFYAAGLACACLLLFRPVESLEQLSRCRWPLFALAAAGVAIVLFIALTADSVAALKAFFVFPFPYFAYFWQHSPALMILFWMGVVLSSVPGQPEFAANIRIYSLIVISIVAGLGAVSQWGGMRYLIGAYPFILLVASYPLLVIHSYMRRKAGSAGIAGSALMILLIIGGPVEGHSVQSAMGAKNMFYGESNRKLILGFDYYPDHQGAGRFVSQNMSAEDIVVVEDALQQYWYIGGDLMWLRDEYSNAQFMYFDMSGSLRDIYVSSKVVRSAEAIDFCNDPSARTWLVTSAETERHRDLYLSEEQRNWLAGVRRNFIPVFVGRDDSTSVYSLPCSGEMEGTE